MSQKQWTTRVTLTNWFVRSDRWYLIAVLAVMSIKESSTTVRLVRSSCQKSYSLKEASNYTFTHLHPLTLAYPFPLSISKGVGHVHLQFFMPPGECAKLITTLPLYKCSQDVRQCDFLLHEWCAVCLITFRNTRPPMSPRA